MGRWRDRERRLGGREGGGSGAGVFVAVVVALWLVSSGV